MQEGHQTETGGIINAGGIPASAGDEHSWPDGLRRRTGTVV